VTYLSERMVDLLCAAIRGGVIRTDDGKFQISTGGVTSQALNALHRSPRLIEPIPNASGWLGTYRGRKDVPVTYYRLTGAGSDILRRVLGPETYNFLADLEDDENG
jgi:hypothetical protein